jgi:lipopolysaccharide/colanic/teichoic acid biosynthesis glycosyltransferase
MDRNLNGTARQRSLESGFASPAREGRRTRPATRDYRTKRAFDLVAATLFFLLLLPVGIVVAGLIGMSGGPIFFRSPRMGMSRRPFQMYKFCTMVPDADRRLEAHLAADPQARLDYAKRYKLKADPRVTRLGGLLRKFNLDELPQLINVFRGDMSLIGPRPRLLREIEEAGRYNTRRFEAYYLCRPGMTGLWQVSGRSETDYHARVRLDALYVRQMSPMQDLSILAKTIPVVCLGRGEY